MIVSPRRASLLARWLAIAVVATALTVGAAVATGAVRYDAPTGTATTSAPVVVPTAAGAVIPATLAASPNVATGPTAVPTLTEQEKAAAYLEQETHEQDYCQCSQGH